MASNGRRYEDVDRECALAMYEIGLSTNEIASELDISQGTILNWVQRHGRPRQVDEARRLRIQRGHWRYGFIRDQRDTFDPRDSLGETARRIGASPSGVQRWAS